MAWLRVDLVVNFIYFFRLKARAAITFALGSINRQATMVIEFTGFTGLNCDAGIGIGGTVMGFVAQ